MRWADVDLERAEWRLTLSKTRTTGRARELVKPLPRQAVEIIAALRPADSDASPFVLPGGRGPTRPLSENAMRAALFSLGLDGREVTMHGFRATARTLLDERHGVRPDIIEHELGHVVKDANGRAYNRTSFVEQRREMLALWADYLERLRRGGEVVPIARAVSS